MEYIDVVYEKDNEIPERLVPEAFTDYVINVVVGNAHRAYSNGQESYIQFFLNEKVWINRLFAVSISVEETDSRGKELSISFSQPYIPYSIFHKLEIPFSEIGDNAGCLVIRKDEREAIKKAVCS